VASGMEGRGYCWRERERRRIDGGAAMEGSEEGVWG